MPGWGGFPYGGFPWGGSLVSHLWTIPGKSWKQQILEFAQEAMPKYWSKAPRKMEDLNAMAEVMATALGVCMDLIRQTYILDSEGKWLRQHARDRGLSLQEGESEAALKQRIREVVDALTRPALLAGVESIMAAAGVVGDVAVVDIRRDRAFFGDYTERTDTGGVFALTPAGLVTFEPTVPFPLPVEVGFPRSGAQGNPRLVLSGAADAGNDGTFEVTALQRNAAVYTNGGGVAAADAGVSWALRKYDVEGNNREGRARAYRGRGYRRGGSRSSFAFILPYGTSAGVANGVRDYLRVWKAFGIRSAVEVRQNP
jgi:hypothetical protein